jgi:hypothetical protein
MIPALTRGTEETQETSVRITDLWDIVWTWDLPGLKPVFYRCVQWNYFLIFHNNRVQYCVVNCSGMINCSCLSFHLLLWWPWNSRLCYAREADFVLSTCG